MKHWEYHLQLADRWISELSSGGIRARVIRLLSLLLELVGDDQGNLELLNYDDMASIIGTSRETFTRMVSQLRSEGMIKRLGSTHLYACNIELLTRESE